jgi:radical SAM superfamily enzyme YgiQ (UPF0313 family)
MKTLLTHGYFLHEDPKEQAIMKPYPTLGLLYISGYLNQHNFKHDVFDTTFSTTEKWKEQVITEQYDVIAFYVNLMTKVQVLKLVDFIKNSDQLKHCKIVLGGPDITYNQSSYLAAGADFLIIGEGEQSMHELLLTFKEYKSVSDIAGISYLDKGELVQNGARTKMKNLDELPLPNRAAYPIEKYLDTWKNHHGQSALNVSTQRGCPYTCKWCSTAVYGQSYRRRSAKSVVAELQELKQAYNPDTIWFVDDVFTVSHKWLEEFRNEVVTSGIQIKYECITRAERMNDKVINWLKESGCFRVWIGAESGSQKIIDAMDRRVDVNRVREMLIKTKATGIETGTFIMVGYPGETIEDIELTAQYLVDSLPDHFTITKSYPIKGTALYGEIEDSITAIPEWTSSTDRQIDFKRKYSDKFYQLAIRYVYNRVKTEKLRLEGKLSVVQKAKSKALKVAMYAASKV